MTRLPLAQWLALELAIVAGLSLLWSLQSPVAGYSALAGGLIFVIPGAYFAHSMYRYEGASRAHLVVGNMFRAESRKLVLTAIMFAAVFILMESVVAPALLFTFAVMVVVGTALRWILRPQPQR